MAFNGFVNSFTNSPIQPSDVSYLPLVFNGASTAIQLEWAFQNPATLYPFCQFIQITGTGTNVYSINMPNALYSSTVQSVIIYNTSSVSVTVYNNIGTQITVCAPNVAYYIGNTDNTTAAGNWLSMTLGAGSSSVIASSLVDGTSNGSTPPESNAGGLKAYGNFLKINQRIYTYSSNAYVNNTSDLGNIVVFNGTGTATLTLMLSAAAANGFIFGVENRLNGGGIITVELSGSDVLNRSTLPLSMQTNETTYFVSDGNGNWYTFCYSSNVEYAINGINIPVLNGGVVTISAVQASFQIQTFTGISGGTATVVYPPNVSQQFFMNNLSNTILLIYLSTDNTDPTYQYTLPAGESLTMFTDGVHLYNSPSFVGNEVIYLPNGTQALPSLTFVNDIHTGIYRDPTSSALIIAQGSEPVAAFVNTSMTVNVPLFLPSGTAALPSYSFIADDTSGLSYFTNTLCVNIAGSTVTQFESTNTVSFVPYLIASGSVTNPGYSFISSTSTGLYYTANILNVSVTGINTTQFGVATTTSAATINVVGTSEIPQGFTQNGISIYSMMRAYS